MNGLALQQFLTRNPKVKKKDIIHRMDGRLEWVCSHGIGHTVWHPKGSDFVHGCDGCCKKVKPVVRLRR